jgi:ATP-dependent helicase/nuclease subunit A
MFDAFARLDADVNRLLARGLLRVMRIASRLYEQLLTDHALLDFAAMLERAVSLLTRQDEFARSRLKLQARYHHVLVDEFQDTSRLQWRLIELLVDAWGEGEGAADAPTSIFVVGDRKQSIYRFRHAEVTLLDEAAARIAALRPGRSAGRAITTSFRAVPELLAFVNALGTAIEGDAELPDRFSYRETDRFPVAAVSAGARRDGQPVIGMLAASTMDASAAAVASEIQRLIGVVTVRDRDGASRPARADDIAILFRARAGHQYFEEALAARKIRSYVYKGLGFFDAPEVQDLQALLRLIARP